MTWLAILALIPAFAYMNAATGSTMPSPFPVRGNDRWWSHWTTAIVQGAVIALLTGSAWLAAAFSVGWYIWRKPEFGYLLDDAAPQTFFGDWLRSIGAADSQWIARWTICALPAVALALPGGLAAATFIALAGFATAPLYIYREHLPPDIREAAAGALWGLAAVVSVLV